MKKLFSLIVILIAFSSCTTDVSTPAPGFQAFKDDVLWRAEDFKAYLYADGHLRIVGLNGTEQVELNVSDIELGSYYLGTADAQNSAGFRTDFNDEVVNYLTYDAEGPIKNVNNPMLIAGADYVEGFDVSTTSTEGGVGMKVDTTVNDSGMVTGVLISEPGIGYEPGDIITITGGNGNAKFKISSEIVITGYTETGITGTFRFAAKNATPSPFINDLVSFQYGSFYNIPVVFVD
ncbi:MAG: DUF6252 family protein [Bacteroidota bacterium]